MSKAAEVEKLARLALSRQAETDMRVDAVDAKAGEAADAAASAGGRTPPPAAAPSLDGLYGWRPEAFSVWFTTGGGGKVGVSFPEKCVSYNGNHMADDVLTPSVQEDPETKFRWCELAAPSEGEPKLVLTLLVELDGATHEPGDTVTVAYLEWAASVDDAKARHAETDRKVVACVPIAEYDAKLDRLSQVHVGALALGGGGGGGGDSELPEPFLYGEYTTEGDEPTHYDHYVRTDGVYGGFLLDGEGKTVSGSGVSVADGDTSVWLVGVGKPKNADDSDWHRGSGGSDEEPDHYEWEFELKKNYSRGQSGAHADDKVVELQLYAFSHCEVTCDYRGQFLPATSGAPVTSSVDDLGPFPPVYGAPQGGLSRIGAGYVQVGGFTIEVAGADVASPTTVVAVDVTVGSGGAPSGVLKQYTSWSGLTGDQTDLNHVYIPIYKLKWDGGDPPKGAVEMDLRRMPMTGMLETFLASSSGSGSGGSGS